MGISGLLPQLRSITTTRAHVSRYRGKTGALLSERRERVWNRCRQLPLSSAAGANPATMPVPAVAVDAYCLLHRGAYTCARELVEGLPTDRHVHYCMSRINLLTDAGVTPLVVFDGGRLPGKEEEERNRERSRVENRERARQLWSQGNRAAATECYQRGVDIKPAHAKQFVEVGAGVLQLRCMHTQ